MYELYYKFTAEPFRLSPDHRFCFEHKSYGKARAYMAYAFKRAEGFVMITGRPGTGKTTLIGELVEGLSKDKVVTANLVCTQLQADDLLKTVAYSFGISPAQVGKAELLQRLNTLLHRWHREGRRALLVVDEAQDLSSSAMEELRLLTNIQFGGQPLLQIFLLGQPELRDLILSPEMEQVHQRIVAASHIEGLEADETEAYVLHRLAVVGWQGNPAIDRAIFPLIHRFSEGVPRRINLICSRLFLLGSVEERDVIGLEDVRVVIGELQAENLAAGTGISQSDFHSHAEPQWAQVPGRESQLTAAPSLQAVSAPSFTATEAPVEPPPEAAKKKDIPSLDPVTPHVVESDHEAAADSVVPVEPVLEEHPLAGGPSVVESPAPDVVEIAPKGAESVLATSTGDTVSSATGRKRIVLTSFLVGALVVLMLLLKDCFPSDGNWSHNASMPAPGAEPDRAPTAVALMAEQRAHTATPASNPQAAPQPRLADLETQGPTAATTSSTDAFESGARSRMLVPVVVTAKRRSVPTEIRASAVKEAAVEQPPLDVGARDQIEGNVTESSGIDQDSVVVESAGEGEWQETILISFPFDSDTLIPDSYLLLDRAATMMRDDAASVASITGFTDDQGDSQYNLVLSRKRASAVERYLVEAGIARERLHVEGRGVLKDAVEGEGVGAEGAPAPYRIVRIELGREG